MTLDTLAGPLISLLLGYALGAIPFGVILTRAAGVGDVRRIGSGNIGATNVLRTGRKGLAAATLFLDAGKGAAAVLIVRALWPEQDQLWSLAALGAFIGHLYPVWLGFRGGKGVATLIGVIAALCLPCAIVAGAIWLLMLALTRFSSLAGMSAAFSAPVSAAVMGRFDLVLLFLGFSLLVFWKHRANVERLLSGTEPRVGSAQG